MNSFSYKVLALALICKRSHMDKALQNIQRLFHSLSVPRNNVECSVLYGRLFSGVLFIGTSLLVIVFLPIVLLSSWMCCSHFLFKPILILKQYLPLTFLKHRSLIFCPSRLERNTIRSLLLMHICYQVRNYIAHCPIQEVLVVVWA